MKSASTPGEPSERVKRLSAENRKERLGSEYGDGKLDSNAMNKANAAHL